MTAPEPRPPRDTEKDLARAAAALSRQDSLRGAVEDLAASGDGATAVEVICTLAEEDQLLRRAHSLAQIRTSGVVAIVSLLAIELSYGHGAEWVVSLLLAPVAGAGIWRLAQGLALAGRKGIRLTLALVVIGAVVLSLPVAALSLFSRRWITYRDVLVGFTVAQPSDWVLRYDTSGDLYSVVFTPRFKLRRDDRQLKVMMGSGPSRGGRTANDCLFQLRAALPLDERVTLFQRGLTVVSGWPAAWVSWESKDKIGGAYQHWTALVSTLNGDFWLEASDWHGDLAQLEPLYRRFLDSFQPLSPGPLTALPDSGLNCPAGFEPYRADSTYIAVCYPADWMAYELPAGVESDQVNVILTPEMGEFGRGFVSFSVRPPAPAAFLRTGEELLAHVEGSIRRGEGVVLRAPELGTLQGQRAVRAAWEEEQTANGVTTRAYKELISVSGVRCEGYFMANGPLEKRELLAAVLQTALETLVLRKAE
ncbi:MAG TPA: hypothetical protein PKW05_06025 [Anaerolineae bacterium]|mgnify:CR=1 FL=1|nr:hypothetical protein [Anaerolineae bacterium]HQJ51317.1 hypothetical protein [Anaerolineae bacterium]